jgi:hypothetical protein
MVLLATLKKYAPSKVRAFVGEEGRDIAVPTRRKRWAQVVTTVESLGAWSRLELIDKSGALLHAIENADPAGELVDLPANGRAADVAAMVSIVVRAQEQALRFRNEEVLGLIRAQSEVTRELTAGMRALTQLYQEQIAVARETATLQAEGDASGDQMKQLMEALPLLLQALPALRGLLSSEPAAQHPRHKNGA